MHNLRLMQIFVASRNAMFLLPVILLYYHEQLGLTFQQFVLGEVAFSITIFVMEVPSGWLSDIWKRKHVLIAGMAFAMLGWGLLLVQGGFFMAVLAQSVIGIGVSLFSGTDAALIYETLAQDGKEVTHYRRQMGLQSALGFYALAAASLVGGGLYALDPRLPIYALLCLQACGLLALLLLEEPARVKQRMEKHPLHDMAVTIHEAFIRRRNLGALIVAAALLFGSTQYVVWAQQKYWLQMNLTPLMCGVLAATAWGLAGVAGHWGHHIEHRIGYRRAFGGIWVALCMAWLVAGMHLGWAGIGGLFLGSIAWAVGWPALQDAINQQIGSERRATIVSAASLIIRLAFMPIGALASHVADRHGVQSSLLLLAGIHTAMGAGVGIAMMVLKQRQAVSAL